MVLLDLFSGTGGFALGFQKAGFTFEKHYFSEIDKHAIANYQYNFPDAIYAGPIQEVNTKKIPKPDLITFGFPCQDLSAAGKHEGLSGKRSGLFFQALRLIGELRPRVFIFENVKGLLISENGKNFETVLKEIAQLGIYDCQWQLLNTSWFLPQNRERIYFVGCLAEKSIPRVFPFTENDFPAEGILKYEGRQPIKYKQLNFNGKGNKSQNHRIYYDFFHSPTITKNNADSLKIFNNNNIRKITPIECERLQGFPDDWTLHGNYNGKTKKISTTQRYRLAGNAVSIPVVQAIAQKLFS